MTPPVLLALLGAALVAAGLGLVAWSVALERRESAVRTAGATRPAVVPVVPSVAHPDVAPAAVASPGSLAEALGVGADPDAALAALTGAEPPAPQATPAVEDARAVRSPSTR